jgi:hypothetical protein
VDLQLLDNMKLTIIVPDKSIILNGVYLTKVDQDLSWIPSNVRALQWYGDWGEIEYFDKDNNEKITKLGIFQQALIDHQNEISRLENIQKEIEENRDYWKEFRRRRDGFLTNSDWTQGNDSPLSDDKKLSWKNYRQELRNLPEKITDPKPLVIDLEHPDWPKQPN